MNICSVTSWTHTCNQSRALDTHIISHRLPGHPHTHSRVQDSHIKSVTGVGPPRKLGHGRPEHTQSISHVLDAHTHSVTSCNHPRGLSHGHPGHTERLSHGLPGYTSRLDHERPGHTQGHSRGRPGIDCLSTDLGTTASQRCDAVPRRARI